MTPENFQKLAQEWETLNEQYDTLIRSGFNNPDSIQDSLIPSLKAMQQKLYNIETEWFSTIETDAVL